MSKVGIAVCCYNRPDYLKQCIASLDENNWSGADVKIVVDDFSTNEEQIDYLDDIHENRPDIFVISKEENKGVAHSKNNALQLMMDEGCTDMFLMEDDILMKSPKTCDSYIAFCKLNKIEHCNFAHHGTMNGQYRMYKGMRSYPNCVGAFSYYTRNCIETVGYMDEKFLNAWEHCEHTYRIVEAGLTTPFWDFVDVPFSTTLLEEIEDSIENSVIRPRDDWQENIEKGKEYWIKKHKKWLPPRE